MAVSKRSMAYLRGRACGNLNDPDETGQNTKVSWKGCPGGRPQKQNSQLPRESGIEGKRVVGSVRITTGEGTGGPNAGLPVVVRRNPDEQWC